MQSVQVLGVSFKDLIAYTDIILAMCALLSIHSISASSIVSLVVIPIPCANIYAFLNSSEYLELMIAQRFWYCCQLIAHVFESQILS